jgi:hypothetical protein
MGVPSNHPKIIMINKGMGIINRGFIIISSECLLVGMSEWLQNIESPRK